MLYLVVFFILALLAASLFLIRIKAAFEYVRNNEDDDIILSFYTMNGIIRYKYEIPLVDMGSKSVKFKLVKEAGRKGVTTDRKKERLKPVEIFDKIAGVKKAYDENRQLVCDIRDYIRCRLLLVEFNLKIEEGTGNAYHTAIINGILWSVAGIFTSYLSNNLKVIKKCVSIVPCFKNAVFTVDFLCIFHVRLVHIIVVLMKIYRKKHGIRIKTEKEIGGGLSG